MSTQKKDIVVIGAGPAGYIAAIKAARLGADVLLAEEREVGGTCLNRGCIPTKYYAHSAHTIHSIGAASSRGIIIADPHIQIDMQKMISGKNATVRRLTSGVSSLLKNAGVALVNQRATVTSTGTVRLADGTVIEAGAVIIATGSQPIRLSIEGIESDRVIDSDAFLDLEEIPRRLTIIGGGVIGMELAAIAQSFSSEVTVVEARSEILPMFSRRAVKELRRILESRGAHVHTSATAQKIVEGNDHIVLSLTNGRQIESDLILIAAGRKADISCFEDPQTIRTESGRIVTDESGRTSLAGVYAAGDSCSDKLLAHSAYHMGEIVAHNACVDAGVVGAKKQTFKLDIIPSVVYSVPEVASVGLSEEEAATRYDTVSGTFPLHANGRALAGGEPEGFVQIVAEKRYGQILGVSCVGMHASEIINEAALAMRHELTVHEVSETIHAHPTVSEALKEAASMCIGQCYHWTP